MMGRTLSRGLFVEVFLSELLSQLLSEVFFWLALTMALTYIQKVATSHIFLFFRKSISIYVLFLLC